MALHRDQYIIRVEPDFRSGSFRFLFVGERPSDLSLTTAANLFPAAEVGSRGMRAPMDYVLVRSITEFLEKAGCSVLFTPEAKETWRWTKQAALGRQNILPASVTQDGLFLHQQIALGFVLARQHAGQFLEMGLGKTRVALLAARERCQDEGGHILVICPRAVISTWRDEAAKWFEWQNGNVFLIRGTGKQKAVTFQAATDFMKGGRLPALAVTNYDTLLDPALARLLSRGKWSAVVFDESTYLKNHRAQRARKAWHLFRNAPHRMILTGEPVTQGPEDLFSQMRVLDEDVLGTKIADFRDKYCVVEPRRFGEQRFNEVVSYQNLDDLGRKVYGACIQFQKHECLDLPERTYEVREVEMTEGQRKLYDDLARDFVGWIRGHEGESAEILVRGVLPQITKLQQITSGFVYLSNGEAARLSVSPKIEALTEFVGQVAPRRKVIVWCRFQEEVDWAEEVSRGVIVHQTRGMWPVVAVDGRVSDTERDVRLTRFREDLDCRVLVAQIASLGFGVNLQAASASIYVSNPWSYEQRLQSEARTHRLGQQSACLYADLICPGTVDVSVLEALRRKATLSELVTTKQWERFVRGEVDR